MTGTKCEHCGTELTASEVESNERTARAHGIDFAWCQLCWDAWGKMQFGWQPGVPENKRVRYVDRALEWDARRRAD